jgi:hypothetical protein
MGVPMFGQEHVDRYRETDGEQGHDWQGTTVLLLTTTARNSGASLAERYFANRTDGLRPSSGEDLLVATI